MAWVPTPGGTFTTPDADESPQLDYITARIAEQVEKMTLTTTTGARRRVHTVKGVGVGQSTDTNGYATFTHGAPFTPSFVQALVHANAATLCVPISTGSITSTQVTVRFQRWDAVGIANAQALNGAVTLICWE